MVIAAPLAAALARKARREISFFLLIDIFSVPEFRPTGKTI
jgi:hypothetical protein